MYSSLLQEHHKGKAICLPFLGHKYNRSHISFYVAVNQNITNFKRSHIWEDFMDLLNSFFDPHQIIHSF